MSLDATVGGIDADSFIDVDDALLYFGARLFSTVFTGADLGDQEAGLKQATRLLDYESWLGDRSDDDTIQRLRFPRRGMYDKDGDLIDSAILPEFLRDATCELTILLMAGDRLAESGTEGFSKIKVDVITLDIDSADRTAIMSPAVREIIGFYLSASPSAVKIVRA